MKAALTALLASVAGGRRHWDRAPQGTPLPYAVLRTVSGIRDYHMQGPSGYVQSRVQVDCYGATFSEAEATVGGVRASASGVRSGNLLGVFIESERDLSTEDAGAVNRPFCVAVDLIIHHIES
jgi:hypothetical protein